MITGQVMDSSGAIIAGAEIQATRSIPRLSRCQICSKKMKVTGFLNVGDPTVKRSISTNERPDRSNISGIYELRPPRVSSLRRPSSSAR